MKVTTLDESIIRDIGHAFGYYDYNNHNILIRTRLKWHINGDFRLVVTQKAISLMSFSAPKLPRYYAHFRSKNFVGKKMCTDEVDT